MERAACRCSDKEKIYDGSSVLSNASSHWCLSGLVRFWLLVSSFLRFMTLIKAMSLSIRLFYDQQVPRAVWTLQTLCTLGIATNLYSASTVFYYFISQTSQYVRYQINCWLFLFFQLFTLHLCWRLSRLCFDLVVALQTPTSFEAQVIQKSQLCFLLCFLKCDMWQKGAGCKSCGLKCYICVNFCLVYEFRFCHTTENCFINHHLFNSGSQETEPIYCICHRARGSVMLS